MSSTNLKIDKKISTDNHGLYEIYPFDRGYGNTFATPLRRILLSSIKGTCITSVKIKGVPHEFSTIKGIQEDVLMIITNLEKIHFKLTSSDKEKVVLKAHGKKVITGADLKIPGNIEIVNPDQFICEMTDDSADLEIEAEVEVGYGFTLGDNEIRNTQPGIIPRNKSFSPVEKVNVSIEATRVAQRTDYEKIVIEIWTKGNVSPDDALREACEVYVQKLDEINRTVQTFDGSTISDEVVEQETYEKTK